MASLVSVTVGVQTSGTQVIRYSDGWRTDVWVLSQIWAHSVTGRSVSQNCVNAVIDTPSQNVRKETMR